MIDDEDELFKINDSELTVSEDQIDAIESSDVVDKVTDEISETKVESLEENDNDINIEASVENEEPLENDQINAVESNDDVDNVTEEILETKVESPKENDNDVNVEASVEIEEPLKNVSEDQIDAIESSDVVDKVTDEISETKVESPEENDNDINIKAPVEIEVPLKNDISNTDVNLPPETIGQDLEISSKEHDKPPLEDIASQADLNKLSTPAIDIMKNVDNSNENVIIHEDYDGNVSDKISELFLTDSSDKTSNLGTNQDSGSHLDVKISTEREECVKKYRELMAEKTQLTLKNTFFHKKLVEYFKKRKISPSVKEYGDEVEKEKLYHGLLLKYEKKKNEATLQTQQMQEKLSESKKVLDSCLQEFSTSFTAFQELEKTTANASIYSTTGKRLSEKLVDRYIARQSNKMEEVSTLRLQWIRYKNMIRDTEQKLRELNKLGGGLHMSDYERLQMENQNLMKKLEERDEQLARQRNLCMEYNQILAHIKEEMHCQDERCETAEYDVTNAERQFKNARGKLTSSKQQHDSLKADLAKEYTKCGLLAHQNLLSDFEATIQMASELRAKKDVLLEEVNYMRSNMKSPKQALTLESVSSAPRALPRLHRTANLKPSIGDCYHK